MEVEVEVVAVEAVVEVGDSLKVVEDGEALPKEVEEGILREEGVSLSRLKGEVVEEVGDVVVEALAVVALLVEEVQVEGVQVGEGEYPSPKKAEFLPIPKIYPFM